MTTSKTFANVWDALEDSSEDAATMTMRSNTMIAIKDEVQRWRTTQAQAARRLMITQPRLTDVLQGKVNKFSRDALLTPATRACLKIKIDIRSAAWAQVVPARSSEPGLRCHRRGHALEEERICALC